MVKEKEKTGYELDDLPVRNSLSRRDNETCICNPCGNEEALFDYLINETIKDLDKLPSSIRVEMKDKIEKLKARESLWLKMVKMKDGRI